MSAADASEDATRNAAMANKHRKSLNEVMRAGYARNLNITKTYPFCATAPAAGRRLMLPSSSKLRAAAVCAPAMSSARAFRLTWFDSVSCATFWISGGLEAAAVRAGAGAGRGVEGRGVDVVVGAGVGVAWATAGVGLTSW